MTTVNVKPQVRGTIAVPQDPGNGGESVHRTTVPRSPLPIGGNGRAPGEQTLPLWQAERLAAKLQKDRETVAETTCRCGAPILTADASGAMPVRLDPAPVDAAGYVVAELSGRPVWGVRETSPGRRVVDDYWPAHPGDPPAHVDVTWHATHRCPTTTATSPATDGTERTEGNR